MPGKNTYRVTNTKHVVHANRRVTNSRGKYGGFSGSSNRSGIYNRTQVPSRRSVSPRRVVPAARGMFARRVGQSRPSATVRTMSTRKY